MCTICNYNMVKDIDRALLAGVTPAALSKQYRFTASELQRHQEHLHQKMTLAAGRFHANANKRQSSEKSARNYRKISEK